MRFRDRIVWSIGDGKNMSFIHDDWAPRLGILQDRLALGKHVSSQVKVCDMVDQNGEWKWAELAVLFHKDTLDHLASCYPPKEVLGADLCLWKPMVDSKFSLKSAYNSLMVGISVQDKSIWKVSWDAIIPLRIK